MENLRDVLEKLDTGKPNTEGNNNPPSAYDTGYGEEPDCKICSGRGWLTPMVPTGHPDFGSIRTCSCRDHMQDSEMSQRLLAYSNLGYLSQYSFENIDDKRKGSSREDVSLFRGALKASSDFAINPSGWLTLIGPHGSGKTHLAAAIANRCISSRNPAFFIYVADLIDHLRSSFDIDRDLGYRELFDQVKNSPILVLDGLSSRSSTQWAQEKLIQIINHRANGKMPTIITTAEDITAIDPFIRSRLEDKDLGKLVRTASNISHDGTPNGSLGKVPDGLKSMSLHGFDKRGRPGTSSAIRFSLESAHKMAEAYSKNPDGWLTLYSPNTGTGKTHLAVAIANEVSLKGTKVFFAFVPEMMDYLRSTFSPESRIDSDAAFEEIKTSPLLILDDLGQERDTNWVEERLYQIIVHRQNFRLPTVVTTRTDFANEAKNGSAVASRIQDSGSGQIVTLNAPDYRLAL